MVIADSDPTKPFNRAQARNNAVRSAGTDAVIVADADTIPSLWAVHAALDNLHGLVYCGDPYQIIDMEWVAKPDLLLATPLRSSHHWTGGIFAIDTSLYWQLGGQDERFTAGWGGEDMAFYFVAETLASITKMPGPMWAFDHDGGDHNRVMPPGNEALYKQYKVARGRPWLMREVLSRH